MRSAIYGTLYRPRAGRRPIHSVNSLLSVARIRELTSRATDKAIERAALTKEWVLDRLRANAEKALAVEGGSSVANRALELLGNHLGLFKEPEQKLPLKLVDLPIESIAAMLAEAEAEAAKEAAAAQAGDGKPPKPVN